MNTKKLTLNLDELAVQSFATSHAGRTVGTVVGYSTPVVETTVEASIEICEETVTLTESLIEGCDEVAATATKEPPTGD